MSLYNLGEFGKALGANAGDYDIRKNSDGSFTLIPTSSGTGAGITYVDTLPTTNLTIGMRVKLNTDYKVYAWNGRSWIIEGTQVIEIPGHTETIGIDPNPQFDGITFSPSPNYIYGDA